MKCLKKVKALPFIKEVTNAGGKVYVVGGAVRDHFLKKESKDLDIVICNISEEELISILSKHGEVDLVGKSFGIIKYRKPGEKEDIDIGLPRRDRKGRGERHTDIEVEVDTTMKIEEDLARRDFTINSIAIDLKGNIIDPFKGREDIKKKQIKMVNAHAFSEDPLRMLRAIQFASRFKFAIEHFTMTTIINNINNMQFVSSERIVIELQKIVDKGNIDIAINLLVESKMLETWQRLSSDPMQFWNRMIVSKGYKDKIDKYVTTLAEFVFVLTDMRSGVRFGEFLKLDNHSIRVLRRFDHICFCSKTWEARVSLFEGLNEGVNMLDTNIFKINDSLSLSLDWYNSHIRVAIEDFKGGHYPKTMKELAVNGNDMIEWGFKGKELGNKLREIVRKIMQRHLENDRIEIKQYIDGLI